MGNKIGLKQLHKAFPALQQIIPDIYTLNELRKWVDHAAQHIKGKSFEAYLSKDNSKLRHEMRRIIDEQSRIKLKDDLLIDLVIDYMMLPYMKGTSVDLGRVPHGQTINEVDWIEFFKEQFNSKSDMKLIEMRLKALDDQKQARCLVVGDLQDRADQIHYVNNYDDGLLVQNEGYSRSARINRARQARLLRQKILDRCHYEIKRVRKEIRADELAESSDDEEASQSSTKRQKVDDGDGDLAIVESNNAIDAGSNIAKLRENNNDQQAEDQIQPYEEGSTDKNHKSKDGTGQFGAVFLKLPSLLPKGVIETIEIE